MLRSTPTSSAPSRSPISKVFYCFGGSLSVSFFLATELLKIFTFFSFFLARFKVLFAFVKVMIGIYEASSVCSLISFRRQTTRCAKPYLNQSNQSLLKTSNELQLINQVFHLFNKLSSLVEIFIQNFYLVNILKSKFLKNLSTLP